MPVEKYKTSCPISRNEGIARGHERLRGWHAPQHRLPFVDVNCVDDHLHDLGQLSRTTTVAKLIEEMKTSSSSWIKTQSPDLKEFDWQAGYGTFSVSQSN